MKIIDFHSHILPGIDDGSASVEESIAMLRMEAEQGIERVVATPHFYPRHNTPEHFLRKRAEAEVVLREEMAGYEGLPRFIVGAEIYFFPGISDSEALRELTIGENRCIILEMPYSVWTESMYREIEGIFIKQNITPIIAHIDRYLRPFHTRKLMERLGDLPVLIQANANFFLRKETKRTALRLLREDKIHLLGSDCHNTSTRVPNMGQALEIIGQHLGSNPLEKVCAHQDTLLAK